MHTREDHERIGKRRWMGAATARALCALSLAVSLSACSGLFPDRPEGRVSADEVEYPNINLAPDRPSDLKTADEQQRMEQELQTLGTQHVKTAQQKIQTQNRRE